MAVLKCKMCGGDLNVTDNSTIVKCEFCDTTQTVLMPDNEKKTNLYNRANRLRFANEFDKAAAVFESLVAEFPEEAEAYWGLVLCKYGIEYVDDPATGNKIPTCHRTSYESIFDDSNFDMVLEYADTEAVDIYRREAKNIDKLQKEILKIASKEKPVDIFICCKETDENGNRTLDSELAQNIYDELTKKGYKIFFARVSLADKSEQADEPYIFSALQFAKVMLVVGTKYKYFNAVWVKNEWSRYLELMKSQKNKTLIPCYKDIDAYDMPKEFKNLQGQDMGKPDFMQNLVGRLEKLISTSKSAQTVNASPSGANSNGGYKQATKELDKTKTYEDSSPKIEAVKSKRNKKIIIALSVALVAIIGAIVTPVVIIPNVKYNKALKLSEEGDYKSAIAILEELGDFKDSDTKIKEVKYDNATQLFKDEKYEDAIAIFTELGKYKDSDTKIKEVNYANATQLFEGGKYEDAIAIFKQISDYEDSKKMLIKCYTDIGKKADVIDAGDFSSVGLMADGTVVVVGDETNGECDVSDWSDIVAVSSGVGYTVGLKSDGTVVAVGDNEDGQCNVFDWSDIVAISARGYHTVGLKSDETVVAVGKNNYGQCDVSDWSDIVAISAGGYHTVGLKSDGTVVAVGDNRYGQCDVSDWSDIVAISAGGWHTLGLKSDGTIVSVGHNEFGQCDVSDWSDIIAISAGLGYTVGLKSDGTVVAIGYNEDKRCDVSDWSDIIAISTGWRYTLGLKSDGTVVAVGNNDWGQCNVSDWQLKVD